MILVISDKYNTIKCKLTKSEMIRSLLKENGTWSFLTGHSLLSAIEVYQLFSGVKLVINTNVEIFIFPDDILYFENWKGEPCNPENS